MQKIHTMIFAHHQEKLQYFTSLAGMAFGLIAMYMQAM